MSSAHNNILEVFSAADSHRLQPLTLFASKVEAGFPSPADDSHEVALDLNQYLVQNPAATFFVRVSGDSMIGAGIQSGDLLVVDRSITPTSNKIIIAVVNGDITVKRFIKRGQSVILQSENPQFAPIHILPDMDFSIWGVVTAVIHKV